MSINAIRKLVSVVITENVFRHKKKFYRHTTSILLRDLYLGNKIGVLLGFLYHREAVEFYGILFKCERLPLI